MSITRYCRLPYGEVLSRYNGQVGTLSKTENNCELADKKSCINAPISCERFEQFLYCT